MDLSKYEIVDLSTDHLNRIFAAAEAEGHQSAYLACLFHAMYGFPVLENDSVRDICGFPYSSENLAEKLMERARDFDQEHHPNVMAGGMMMNNGPSKREWLSGMEVAVPPVKLEGFDDRLSPGAARGVLPGLPLWSVSKMAPNEWAERRPGLTVKMRHLVKDVAQHARTVGMLAEAIKEPIFLDENRHAGPKTTRELAEALRQDGALLPMPPYLQEDEQEEEQAA